MNLFADVLANTLGSLTTMVYRKSKYWTGGEYTPGCAQT